MRPEPFAEVEILRDDPSQCVQAGLRGHLLDWLPGLPGEEEGAVIEPRDSADRAGVVVVVPQSWVRAVSPSAAETESPPRRRAV